MVICGDTSFFFSLYGNDANSGRATRWIRKCREPLRISPFNTFELGNALRFAAFRKAITEEESAGHWAGFEAAIRQERLVLEKINLLQVLSAAERISAQYTRTEGYRSFDILHVAAAVILGADTFLTFDRAQSRLAEAEGLQVLWP